MCATGWHTRQESNNEMRQSTSGNHWVELGVLALLAALATPLACAGHVESGGDPTAAAGGPAPYGGFGGAQGYPYGGASGGGQGNVGIHYDGCASGCFGDGSAFPPFLDGSILVGVDDGSFDDGGFDPWSAGAAGAAGAGGAGGAG